MSTKTNVEDTNSKLPPFTHVSLDTGHCCLIPADKVKLDAVPELTALVRAGGGPIPATNGRYRFCLTSEDTDTCVFDIRRDEGPLVVCVFQNPSPCAQGNWDAQFAFDAILPEALRLRKKVAKPAEPWLSVRVLPTVFLAGEDISLIAELEQHVAEAWRQLSPAERTVIGASALASRNGYPASQGPGIRNASTASSQPSEDAKLAANVERLTKQNSDLERTLKGLRATNHELGSQLQSLVSVRHEADRLRNESSAKDARIRSLEADLAAVRAKIERNVVEQVGDIRKTAVENELRALVAEEEALKAHRTAENAESKIRHLERLLRKNAIEPATAFADGGRVSCG